MKKKITSITFWEKYSSIYSFTIEVQRRNSLLGAEK